MPFSKDEIEDLKAEVRKRCERCGAPVLSLTLFLLCAQCFANDVKYNYDVLKDWDEDKIRDFFESGGGGEGAAPSMVVAAGGFGLPSKVQE